MDEIIEAVFDEYGGREGFFRETEENLAKFNDLWSQDLELIGRVLRAHLVVEHFLTEFIQARNPDLPSLREASLTFDQKLRLLPDDALNIKMLEPGIRRLNQIRNRIAHNLALDLSTEDRSSFLGIQIFSAIRNEKKKRDMPVGEEPIEVLEDFSKMAGSWLQGRSDGTAEKVGRAIERFKPAEEQS